MSNILQSTVITTGLAIFSMFFGAGNLMYPIMVGINSGEFFTLGIAGFLITAVLLPLAGLIAMILFDGDYQAFFNRLGKIPGSLMIAASMIIIGPLIAIPRIVTLSHVMTAPFIPWETLQTITPLSSLIFALFFLGITFLCTYRENSIVNLLGNIVSPLLVISLAIIVIKGLITGDGAAIATAAPWTIFSTNFIRGYETLDLLGGIFFASIVIKILKSTEEKNLKKLALLGLKSGLIGVFLLGMVYIGLGLLGLFNGSGMAGIPNGALFRQISFKVLGAHGALVIATAVLMACLSTAIALSAVIADYTREVILKKSISFPAALILVLLASLPLSIFGLEEVLKLTGGVIVYVGYPMLIMLTLVNIAYKLFGFKPVKTPVVLTFVIALVSYYSDKLLPLLS